jgi:hypothetical protein
MVQLHGAIERSDLRALVADYRAGQAEPFHPRQGTWEGAAGARHHQDSRRRDAADRGYVTRIELQLHVDDRAVEV